MNIASYSSPFVAYRKSHRF